MNLSKKHLRLLKAIENKTIVRTNKRKIKDLEYLRSLELITAISVDKEDDFYYQPEITEKGKAVLYERLYANKRANIALALSILSLIISSLSLLISFFTDFLPTVGWIWEGISSIIQSTPS